MSRTQFETLDVYKLSESLGDAAWSVVSKWESFERNTVGSQLARSADSVGANIAEGAGRGSYKDNQRFVKIARGSLYETKHWLRRAFRRELLNENNVNDMKVIIDELTPKLNAYLKSIGSKAKDN